MNMRKIMKKAGKVLSFAVMLCMLLTMTLPVFAEEEGGNGLVATEDPRDSIMLMTLGYEDDNGDYKAFKSGTCFLINDEYVLTNKHVVTLTNEELTKLREWSNVPDNILATDKHIKLYLYVNRDMKVNATMHESVNSDDMDFAAVKLSEKIYDRKPIALGDSSQIETKETVYAMGFPDDSIKNKEYNTKEDVSTVDGTISKVTVTGGVDIIEHTAPLSFGNSGGPLLDVNNNVIGVNSFFIPSSDGGAVYGKKDYSIQINYIKKGLDTFGIPYVKGDGSSEASEPITNSEDEPSVETGGEVEVDNTAFLAELQSALDDAKKVDTSLYTDESVKTLNDKIGTAESVLRNQDADVVTIQNAADDLNEAVTALEEKPKMNILPIAIGGAAAVVIIIIIIVVVMSGKKKKASAGSVPVASVTPGPTPAPAVTPGPVYQPQPMQEGAGETTLLDAGVGETTLLGGAGGAYLIRKKNGEKILINAQNFKIGKERRKVNYCVSDNTSVSRVHCEIVKKGSDYYVVDQGATNFTFVNGVQLSPRKETLLSNQSVLKLSDEEFEFYLS